MYIAKSTKIVKRVCIAHVIKHILVVQGDTDHETKKVQSEEHLQCPSRSETLSFLVQGEIAKACHEHVCSYVYTNCVVHLFFCKVVIQQKHQLHPAFPLICLLALQRLCIVQFLHGAQRSQTYYAPQPPKL